MGAIVSQITSLTIVYSNDYSDADQKLVCEHMHFPVWPGNMCITILQLADRVKLEFAS